MSRRDDQWIVVLNWDKFQHYKDRDPAWIKLYTSLLHNADYVSLSPTCRALLTGLWQLYAVSHCQLRVSDCARALRMTCRAEHLKRLSDAGFIELRASRPLALARSREEEKKEEKKRAPARARGAAHAEEEEKPEVHPENLKLLKELTGRIGNPL